MMTFYCGKNQKCDVYLHTLVLHSKIGANHMSDNITAVPFTRNPVVMFKKMPPAPKNDWIQKLSKTDAHTKECQLYKSEASTEAEQPTTNDQS